MQDGDLLLLERHNVPTRDLLAFYRARLAAADAEREDAMCAAGRDARARSRTVCPRPHPTPLSRSHSQRLVDVEAANAELHRVRWERRSREEEVRELQSALSDAKVFLFDEREQLLRVQAENDELKAQEIEDRKRIAHLLALTEPMTQEVRAAAAERACARAPGQPRRAAPRRGPHPPPPPPPPPPAGPPPPPSPPPPPRRQQLPALLLL